MEPETVRMRKGTHARTHVPVGAAFRSDFEDAIRLLLVHADRNENARRGLRRKKRDVWSRSSFHVAVARPAKEKPATFTGRPSGPVLRTSLRCPSPFAEDGRKFYRVVDSFSSKAASYVSLPPLLCRDSSSSNLACVLSSVSHLKSFSLTVLLV